MSQNKAIDGILDLQLIGLDNENQQLIFNIADRCLGMSAMKVKEIIRFTPPVRIPKNPPFVLGVINLRGEIIPVFTLRALLGLPEEEKTANSVIIIIESSPLLFGFAADQIIDIISLTEEQIQAVPELARNAQTEYIRGVADIKKELIKILDIEKIIEYINRVPAGSTMASQPM